jgi:hypothetical protein
MPSLLLENRELLSIRPDAWAGSFVAKESTLHQLSPYIGKLKSGMAAELISQLTAPGDAIYDPFAGSGTVALEAWAHGRNVYANDLSPYAKLLLTAKLRRPPPTLDQAKSKLIRYSKKVEKLTADLNISNVPQFAREFFHHQTLREILAWCEILTANDERFFLACLMGILHHQRPGFLSYPASHAVPYLRTAKFPRSEFPVLYEYRSVLDRLERKVERALRRVPELDPKLIRSIHSTDASALRIPSGVHAIITSPPYMRRLSYARDNRLRLWFLGVQAIEPLDRILSPRATEFLTLMKKSLLCWHSMLKVGGYCALVVGDESLPGGLPRLPEALIQLATAKRVGFRLADSQSDPIPPERRVRRNASGSKSEAIIVLQKVS